MTLKEELDTIFKEQERLCASYTSNCFMLAMSKREEILDAAKKGDSYYLYRCPSSPPPGCDPFMTRRKIEKGVECTLFNKNVTVEFHRKN